MNSPKLLIALIALLVKSVAFAQEPGNIKVLPVSFDQLTAKPIFKYDTLPSSDAPCTPAVNDNYSNAIILTVGASALNGRSCGSVQAGEALGCNSFASQSVWYKVTATANITYVIIDATGSNCYAGAVIWPATGLPTGNCQMIDCQSAANGPALNVFKIDGATGTTYAIQVTYLSGFPCGKEAAFTISAANTYPAAINNPGSVNTCATAYNSCYFTSTPTVSQITSNCTAYPLTTQGNLVNTAYYKLTTASVNSNVLNFQNLLATTCGSGNVSWFTYRLFDQYCNLLTCGNIGSLQNNIACNQPYIIEYKWEQLPMCTYTQQIPFQYVPSGTIGCGIPLPIELLSFDARVRNKNVQLTWITAKEINNEYFAIERSANYLDFEPIVKIKGQGNSSTLNRYAYEDALPADGQFYYRLKQVDFNGNYKYTEVIAVASINENTSIAIKNPAHENAEIVLENELESEALVCFINNQGTVCSQVKWHLTKGLNQKSFSINNLKPGIYTVRVTSQFFTCHQKLVKV